MFKARYNNDWPMGMADVIQVNKQSGQLLSTLADICTGGVQGLYTDFLSIAICIAVRSEAESPPGLCSYRSQ